MDLPIVYADFNSLESSSIGEYDSRVGLTGYGSLKSLSRQKIKMSEGMRIIVFEPQDIEAEGVAYFDRDVIDPAGRSGEWFVLINEGDIRVSNRPDLLGNGHLCFECGEDIDKLLTTKGRNYTEKCPQCRTSIMKPLEPPKDKI